MTTPANDVIELFSEHMHRVWIALNDSATRAQVYEQIKKQADLYWGKDRRVSLGLANLLITAADYYGDAQYVALGTMARGDALRLLGRVREAHAVLEHAGELFRQIPDEVGWARTRIGRLFTSSEFGAMAVNQAVVDAGRARSVFIQYQRFDLLARLCFNLSAFHQLRHEFADARLALYSALDFVSGDDPVRAQLYHNLGILEQVDGKIAAAEECYAKAVQIAETLSLPMHTALYRSSQAGLEMLRGNYRQALVMLQALYEHLGVAEQFRNKISQIICLRSLGAVDKAIDLATDLIASSTSATTTDLAVAQLHMGESYAEYRQPEKALKAVLAAQQHFEQIDARQMQYEIALRKAQIYLQQGALEEAILAADQARLSEDKFIAASAHLTLGWVALQQTQPLMAIQFGLAAGKVAASLEIAALRFNASRLLASAREAQGRYQGAALHYRSANRLALHLQRDLSIDFRPGFLESTQAAFQGLVRVYLRQQQIDKAFETIEALKSLVVLQHLGARMAPPNQDQPEREQFQAYRERYLWLLDQDSRSSHRSVEARAAEKKLLEQQMLDLRARMRLAVGGNDQPTAPTHLPDIQHALADDMTLIEYYHDDEHIFAFLLTPEGPIQLVQLPGSVGRIRHALERLHDYMERALAVDRATASKRYLASCLQILQSLHAALVAPLIGQFSTNTRCVIIPYGVLHTVPFHLLHDAQHYLLEQREITIYPSSALLMRTPPVRQQGALSLSYSAGDDAYRMDQEAVFVHELFGGAVYCGETAKIRQLMTKPVQILHLAAHGKFNPSQPRLSYVRLADGPLYADDLFQFPLDYELVLLSACSVGVSQAAGGDELLGFGHSVLYAGAGAVISGLWDVDDASAETFTRLFYQQLHAGASKSNAMRSAQVDLLNVDPNAHPAYWGAFQLVGHIQALNG